MATLAERISDKRKLKLSRAFETAGVMENGLVGPVEEGTPQGGTFSQLLSNIVHDDLDQKLGQRGKSFARYSDDCNIYVRNRASRGADASRVQRSEGEGAEAADCAKGGRKMHREDPGTDGPDARREYRTDGRSAAPKSTESDPPFGEV